MNSRELAQLSSNEHLVKKAAEAETALLKNYVKTQFLLQLNLTWLLLLYLLCDIINSVIFGIADCLWHGDSLVLNFVFI